MPSSSNQSSKMQCKQITRKAMFFIFFFVIQGISTQEAPEVEFTNETVEDPRTVTLHWRVKNDGNLPVTKFSLYSDSSIDEEFVEVDSDIRGDITHYTSHDLLPGVTYRFRLAAFNEAGQSDFAYHNVTMPADVPPKVSWIIFLASTNDTLLFGWRRPKHDNGANITHYNVRLHDQNGSLPVEGVLRVITPGRNNHMYIFLNLKPAEKYIFKIQACNALGCGSWSKSEGATIGDEKL